MIIENYLSSTFTPESSCSHLEVLLNHLHCAGHAQGVLNCTQLGFSVACCGSVSVSWLFRVR